jgi:hypothetical protein
LDIEFHVRKAARRIADVVHNADRRISDRPCALLCAPTSMNEMKRRCNRGSGKRTHRSMLPIYSQWIPALRVTSPLQTQSSWLLFFRRLLRPEKGWRASRARPRQVGEAQPNKRNKESYEKIDLYASARCRADELRQRLSHGPRLRRRYAKCRRRHPARNSLEVTHRQRAPTIGRVESAHGNRPSP